MTDLSRSEMILEQLGGRQFVMMTGAKHRLGGNDPVSLSFKLGSGMKIKGGITHVRIVLNDRDLYEMEFLKIRGTKPPTVVAKDEDVYAEDLRRFFYERTGLNTSLTSRY